MREGPGGGDPDRNLASLEARLAAARTRHEPEETRTDAQSSVRARAIGLALRLSVELVASIGIGAGAGFLLDRWLGSLPLFLMIFFALGCAAGVRLVMRTAAEMKALSEHGRSDS